MTDLSIKSKEHDLSFGPLAELKTNHYGSFSFLVVTNSITHKEHAVLIKGSVRDRENVLCRIASECLPGMVFDYVGCECAAQMHNALEIIGKSDQGILIFLRQEGRGHGLDTKIRALINKNKGDDTFTAVERLGLSPDVREYWEAAKILEYLGIKSIELLSNNPDKVSQLAEENIVVSGIRPLPISPTVFTRQHLLAKKEKGHLLPEWMFADDKSKT